MSILLELKGKLKEFYEKNYTVLRPIIRFILAFVCFFLINKYIGQKEQAAVSFVPIVLALICSMLPDTFIVYFSAVLAAGQVFAISSLLGIALAIFFLVIFLMIGRYDASQLFIILAIPLCSIFHLSYVVPIVSALFVGPVVLPAIILGVVMQYVYISISAAMAAPELAVASYDSLEMFQYVINQLLKSQEMLLSMAAFVFAYAVTYFIRKRKVYYASQLAILLGSFVMIGTVLIGNIVIKANIDIVLFSIGMLISVGIAYMIQFFRMTLDYMGTRSLQFEDDEYYYYVKAVPKLKVAMKDKTVTRINPKDEAEEVDNLQEEFDKVFNEENSKN